MKEIRYFYAPDAPDSLLLPPDEAAHCVRVLRLAEGDTICLTDGKGLFLEGEIVAATPKKCMFRVVREEMKEREWSGHLHIAVAPTKNSDRMEWLAEKATEIGFDELTFLDCKNSERKVVKTERIDKILVSAMKQSHKAYKPQLNGMTDFMRFISQEWPGQKFIAHCYDEADVLGKEQKEEREKEMTVGKPFLPDVLDPQQDALVMVGPEGDFSIEEVQAAHRHGFRSVSLGRCRLRTETAALVAVHLMNLKHALE